MNKVRLANAMIAQGLFPIMMMFLAAPHLRAESTETIRFEGVPATFALPSGWKVMDRRDNVALLMPAVNQPEYFVVTIANVYSSIDAFYSAAADTIDAELTVEHVQILEEPRSYQVNGLTASSATIGARNPNGDAVRIGLNVVMAADGVSLGVMTLSSVPKFPQANAAVQSIMQSARFSKLVHDRRAASGLAGRWVRAGAANSGNRNGASGGWSSGSNVTYTFYEDGTYSYFSESFIAVDVPGMSSLGSSEDRDSGRYSVSGSNITLISEKDGASTLTFRQVDDRYIQIGNSYFARQ